ncbi:MAG: alpha-L-rhamnosidase N-terminal domain-containing protein, partial [Candidatus Hydrogenedentes bacterium]|nr:alpha-L-rhamnosidase N-terminal domain-containing protein [Candidatus Hydrogenedentota bacterium]
PPSDEVIGPEIRSFRYREERGADGVEADWHLRDFDDSDWQTTLYSTGPYWLVRLCDASDETLVRQILESAPAVAAGTDWQEVNFSKSIGLAQAAPWGGHSGYPDGHIDKNFIDLPEGRKLLFTRIHVPKAQRCGLRVELGNATPRLWVNGEEQPFEEAVGNLPLREGENTVLLDLPDGGHGRLFVQAAPPTVASMAEAAQGGATPEIETASWIWAGHSQACYVRKDFDLDRAPKDARLTVSVNSGFRLFVNGEKIEEEIGPWANWQKPETFTITPVLRKGRNTIAIWGQLFVDQSLRHSEEAFQARGIVLAMKVRLDDGKEVSIVTDDSWRGAVDEFADWQSPDFDDRGWTPVTIRGKMGDAPWGMAVVENVGAVTVPKRPLSIDLDNPYLECFDEMPGLVYDVKRSEDLRVGWYRFEAPPGLQAIVPPGDIKAQFWVDGEPVALIRGGAALLPEPAPAVSTVAMRVEMQPGAYAGAAFPEPIDLQLGGGTIGLGLWSEYALPTYSGIGVYGQVMRLEPQEGMRTWLDLGQVLVAAEVLVNGKNAGVRIARPFKFDITDLIQNGENEIEIRVANTIAPHYTTIPAMNLGPTESGLLGPVRLTQVSDSL